MIEVYKILTNKYDSRENLFLEKQQDSITRGHSLKLVNKRCYYDLIKFSLNCIKNCKYMKQLASNSNISRYNKDLINFGNTRIYRMTTRLS